MKSNPITFSKSGLRVNGTANEWIPEKFKSMVAKFKDGRIITIVNRIPVENPTVTPYPYDKEISLDKPQTNR
ncbi:hypothetical protein KAR91_50955 [Candidatus Pacearchaeota archaeon]|nr:hypothetical protein [Candidatus Pacearchaeota archaeon]